MRIEGVERPLGHRVRHLRETRQEVVIAHTKPRNAVERVGDDIDAAREGAEQQANVGDLGAETGADFPFGVRMQHQIDIQRLRYCLPGMVVGRVADAAEAEDHIAGSQSAPERGGDARTLVAEVLDPGQAQASQRKQLGNLRKVPVDAFSRQDLVTEDDRPETHVASFSVSGCLPAVTTAPCRQRRSASRQ